MTCQKLQGLYSSVVWKLVGNSGFELLEEGSFYRLRIPERLLCVERYLLLDDTESRLVHVKLVQWLDGWLAYRAEEEFGNKA